MFILSLFSPFMFCAFSSCQTTFMHVFFHNVMRQNIWKLLDIYTNCTRQKNWYFKIFLNDFLHIFERDISWDVRFTVNWWFDSHSPYLFLKTSLVIWGHYAWRQDWGNWKYAIHPHLLHQVTSAHLGLVWRGFHKRRKNPPCIQHCLLQTMWWSVEARG